MQQTDWVTVDKLKPGEVTEEDHDDALIEQRDTSKPRKIGKGGIFQQETHKEQGRGRKEDLIEKGLQGYRLVCQKLLDI